MTDLPPNVAPLHRLSAELDDAPIAGQPGPRAPGDGLDPPDPAPDHDTGPDPDHDAPPPPPPRGRSPRPHGEIWDGCPVKALGVNGATTYFLDVLGQLRPIAKLERMTIMHLFGRRYEALCAAFPQFDKDMKRRPGKFDGDSAAAAMTQAASERGLFDPEGAVRGVGAWADDDGGLIYHMGKALLINGQEHEPCTHQGRIYPSYPSIPAPALSVKTGEAVSATLDTLQGWQWERPHIDPFLMLGTIGVQMMGGALDWRPHAWLNGPAGSGKSSLQKLIEHLHGGDKGIVQSSDATARGIAALLGSSTTLPVAMDEIEPDENDSPKARAIVELARIASSGAKWLRGSSDQKGATGQLRSTFLFSSILVPGALKSQDRQRLMMFNLHPFAPGSRAPDLRAETWRKRGAALKRILIDRWPLWAARLEAWREEFRARGLTGRIAQDNWATTLAMADLVSTAEIVPETIAGWAAKVAEYILDSQGSAGTDADEVLTHLLSMPYMLEGGREQYTIAQWVQVAALLPAAPKGLLGTYTDDQAGQDMRAKVANEKLAKLMLRVIRPKRPDDGEPMLFIGDLPVQGLKQLFRGTQWADGAWSQSLRRVKGARFGRATGPRKLAGLESRGVEIPLSSLPGLAQFPADKTQAPVNAASPATGYKPEDFA